MFWYLVGLWGAYSAKVAPLTLRVTYVTLKKAIGGYATSVALALGTFLIGTRHLLSKIANNSESWHQRDFTSKATPLHASNGQTVCEAVGPCPP